MHVYASLSHDVTYRVCNIIINGPLREKTCLKGF